MTLLNVSFGIYAFMPHGWLFMIAIIIVECLSLTYLLKKKFADALIYKTVIFSNFISGLFGIIISMFLNGGWWLVVWFPWVSNYEVKNNEQIKWLILYYAIAFMLTLIIESLINKRRLKYDYANRRIIVTTICTNVISYLLGSTAMYSYSFS